MIERVEDAAGDRSTFVQAWLDTLAGAGGTPVNEPCRRLLLAGLADRLQAALVTDRFDAAVGRRVGAELVAGGFAGPEALARTVMLVQARLADGLPASARVAVSARVSALAGQIAAGFTDEVYHRTLDAQEALQGSAQRALAVSERQREQAEAALAHHASHDPITDLPNRVVLLRRLTDLLHTASAGDRLALCCVDLDRFVTVSDSLGHEVAWQLLRAVAARLQQLAASAGWQLTHVESDQFAILVEHTTCGEDAIKVADRVLDVLRDPFLLRDLELPITGSAGVIERPAAGDPARWLQAAQTALHWAQADGGDRWRLYEHERGRQDTARYRMSADLPKALRRREIAPYYQPLVELSTGRVVGYEALARWHHPEQGLLNAGRFIDLAERTGVLVALSYQLLNQACQHAASWPADHERLPYLSVNLAAGQLRQPSLVAHITQTLDHTGLPPRQLQLEITEQTIIDPSADADEMVTTLRVLANLGVRLAVDDFGTGYSNLVRLRDLPVSTVKLDASLAKPQKPTIQARHQEFLAAVVGLARTLGMTVTAEGIETHDHRHRMHAAGCDTGQGWLYGKPVPADHIIHRR